MTRTGCDVDEALVHPHVQRVVAQRLPLRAPARDLARLEVAHSTSSDSRARCTHQSSSARARSRFSSLASTSSCASRPPCQQSCAIHDAASARGSCRSPSSSRKSSISCSCVASMRQPLTKRYQAKVELGRRVGRDAPVEHDDAVSREPEVRAAQVALDERARKTGQRGGRGLRIVQHGDDRVADVRRDGVEEDLPADDEDLRQVVGRTALAREQTRRRERDPVGERAEPDDALAGEDAVERGGGDDQAPALRARQTPIRRQQSPETSRISSQPVPPSPPASNTA